MVLYQEVLKALRMRGTQKDLTGIITQDNIVNYYPFKTDRLNNQPTDNINFVLTILNHETTLTFFVTLCVS